MPSFSNRFPTLLGIVIAAGTLVGMQAHARGPADGVIVSDTPYTFPSFEDSGFGNREVYETDIKKKFLAASAVTDMQSLIYGSDGLKIQGFVLKSKNTAPDAKLPIVIWNRGGNRDFSAIDAGDMTWLAKLAQKGYLVVATNLRGAPGSEGNDEYGGRDVHDVLNAIKAAKKLPNADASNVFMAGHSRGGMETYLALKADHSVRAAVTLAGSADERKAVEERPEFDQDFREMIPGYPASKVKALAARSAVTFAGSIKTPLMLMQGTEDSAVNPAHAPELAAAIQKAGGTVKLDMRPGGHNLWFYDKFTDSVQTQMDQWFRKYYVPGAGSRRIEQSGPPAEDHPVAGPGS